MRLNINSYSQSCRLQREREKSGRVRDHLTLLSAFRKGGSMSESMKQTPRSCPVEATMIAVLDIIVGLLLVLISVPLGFLDLGLAGERIPAVLDALAGFALGLAACIGLATLVVAWGLWKLKPWAFWVHRLQLDTRDATEQAEREE